MLDELRSGSLVVRIGSELPPIVRLSKEVSGSGWRVLSGMDPSKVEYALKDIGWRLFYVVDPLSHATAFAFDRSRAIEKALRKMLRRAESQHLNAAEITNVRTRRVGPLYKATVEINFRHIGETPVLFEKRKHETGVGERSMAARAA